MPYEQRVTWIWALIICYSIPEIGTIIRAFRILLFKNTRKPVWYEILIVAIVELLSTTGLGLLVFIVLPRLDAIKGLMLMNCFCFFPSIFCK